MTTFPTPRAAHCLFAILCFVGALCQSASAAPSPASGPRVVHVALQIRNLAAVDEIRENWLMTGTLISTWQDASLAYVSRGSADQHHAIRESAWRPLIGIRNDISPAAFEDVESYVQPNGTVVDWRDFSANLSTDLDLRRFPFDFQDLPIIIEPVGVDANQVVLVSDPTLLAIPQAQYAGLSQWKAISLTARPYAESAVQLSARGLRFDFRVRRNAASYLWKFIIPLLLLVMVSWVSFWLSPREFTTKDQLGTAISTLLIVVAFDLASSSLLPRTSYVTYIDALLFVSLLFVIISIAFIVATHLLEARSSQSALLLRRTAGIVLPVSFLLTQLVLIRAFGIWPA